MFCRNFLAVVSVAALIAVIACSKDSSSPTAPTPTTGATFPPGFVQTTSIVVDDAPCVLNVHTPSCTFRAVAARPGFQTLYSYTWRLTNPANGRGIQFSPPSTMRLPMDCVFLPNAGTSTITVRVTATIGQDVWETATISVPVTRSPGTC
jgi:hypothetical protein